MSHSTKYYYWLLSVRGILLAYLCVFFSLYPFIQLIVMTLFQGFIISLFFNGRKLREVFETRSLTIMTLTEELLLLVTKAMILIFIVSDYFVDGDDWFLTFGWLIILPGMISQIAQSLYLVGVKIKDRKKMVKKLKSIVDHICRKKSKIQKIRRIQQVMPTNLHTNNTSASNIGDINYSYNMTTGMGLQDKTSPELE